VLTHRQGHIKRKSKKPLHLEWRYSYHHTQHAGCSKVYLDWKPDSKCTSTSTYRIRFLYSPLLDTTSAVSMRAAMAAALRGRPPRSDSAAAAPLGPVPAAEGAGGIAVRGTRKSRPSLKATTFAGYAMAGLEVLRWASILHTADTQPQQPRAVHENIGEKVSAQWGLLRWIGTARWRPLRASKRHAGQHVMWEPSHATKKLGIKPTGDVCSDCQEKVPPLAVHDERGTGGPAGGGVPRGNRVPAVATAAAPAPTWAIVLVTHSVANEVPAHDSG
jgi:hypothetical protein